LLDSRHGSARFTSSKFVPVAPLAPLYPQSSRSTDLLDLGCAALCLNPFHVLGSCGFRAVTLAIHFPPLGLFPLAQEEFSATALAGARKTLAFIRRNELKEEEHRGLSWLDVIRDTVGREKSKGELARCGRLKNATTGGRQAPRIVL